MAQPGDLTLERQPPQEPPASRVVILPVLHRADRLARLETPF